MTDKPKKRTPTDIDLGEAAERFAKTDPKELAQSIAADVLQARARIKKRVAAARREIEDGARPRKGRFRL